jgi:hypothetical protein
MKYASILSTLTLAFVLAACAGSGGTGNNTLPTPSPDNISITAQSTNLEPDQSTQYSVKDAAGNTITSGLTWTSSQPTVAEVSSAGIVTAKSTGKTTITANLGTLEAKYDLNVTLTLRVGVRANGNAPLTVFVSDNNGSPLESKTINPGEAAQVFVFKNVPGDALVTSAYQLSKTDFYCVGGTYTPNTRNIYRLSSYPAGYVNGRTFYLGGNEYLTGLTAALSKPNFGASHANGTGPHFYGSGNYDAVAADPCGSNGSAATNTVTMNGALTQAGTHSNGLYSPIFYAFNANWTPVAYRAFKDLPVPRTPGERNLTVGANDWQTDLRTLNIVVKNFEGTKSADGSRDLTNWDCSRIHGSRLGVRYDNPIDCSKPAFDPVRNTLTRSLKYAPNFFTTSGYEIGFGAADFSNNQDNFWYVVNQKRELASLPDTLTLDANADFLKPVGSLTLSAVNTDQPSLNWTNPGNLDPSAAQRYTEVNIRSNSTGFDYDWTFWQQPSDQTSLKVPTLPSSLSGFAPKEGAGGRTYYAGVNFIENFAGDGGWRSAFTRTYFSKALGTQNLSSHNRKPVELEHVDPYAIGLK